MNNETINILSSCIQDEVLDYNLEKTKEFYDKIGFYGVFTTENSYIDYFKSSSENPKGYLRMMIEEKIESDKEGFINLLKEKLSSKTRRKYEEKLGNIEYIETENAQIKSMLTIIKSIDNQLCNTKTITNKKGDEVKIHTSNFVQRMDPKVIKISERLAKEIEKYCEHKEYLAILVFAGSLLESFFVGLLWNTKNKKLANDFKSCPSAPNKKDASGNKIVPDFQEWDFVNFITVASKITPPIFSGINENTVQYIREARNMIHPNKQFRENFIPDIHSAIISINALKSAFDSLERYFQ